MRRFPGNDRCADCNKVFPQWASVTFGNLLCLDCAGKHRALGVQTSFVKSLSMDTWTPKDLLSLEYGGNGKWNAVCMASGLHKLTTSYKYASTTADAYRARMQDAVLCETPFTLVDILTELNLPLDVPQSSPVRRHASMIELPPPASPVKVHLHKQPSLEVKCTLCHAFLTLSELDSHSTQCASTALPTETYEEIEFDTALGKPHGNSTSPSPLGLSLSRSSDGDTMVSRITPGGDADLAGVLVGSRVLAINGLQTPKFDALMKYLSGPASRVRPISFTFSVRRQVHVLEIELTEEMVGCHFVTSIYGHCVVKSVDTGGHAATQGLQPGMRVVEVNDGQTSTSDNDSRGLMAALTSRRRPLRLRVHKYLDAKQTQAFMRLWS
ncbi:unnamed protein product [Aphanomyces euteiches]